MCRVIICVVLVILGNVNSFGISRARRDLEQTILDVYGPPSGPKQMDHHHQRPQQLVALKPDHDAVKEDVGKNKGLIPQGILDNIFGPQTNKLNPDAESPVPHFFSAIITDVKNTEQDEAKAVADIFGTPPSPAPEAVTPTHNSTASNTTGLDVDDRFLSESLLRQQWTQNRETSEKGTEKHAEKPQARVGPEPKKEAEPPAHEKERGLIEPGLFEDRQPLPLDPTSSVPRHSDSGPLEPGGVEPTPLGSNSLEPKHSEPTNQTSKPTSTNASSRTVVSKSLVLLLVYFCLESLVSI